MTDSLIPLSSSLPAIATPANAPLLAYLNKYKGSTRATMTRYLSIVVNLVEPLIDSKQQTREQVFQRLISFDWQAVDVHFCNRVLRLCQDKEPPYSRSTRNTILLALRGIAKQRRILKQITKEDLQDISEIGKSVRGGNPVKTAKSIPPENLLKMLEACEADENKLLGKRDFALLSLLFGSGLRAAEAVGLTLSQIDFSAGTLTVIGKGQNKRVVWPVEGVLDAIVGWLNFYGPAAQYGAGPGQDFFLFPAFSPPSAGGGVITSRTDKHLSYQGLYYMVRKRGLQAGVPIPSPHWFRHSFATETYQKTRDLYGLQHQMGHRSGETTKLYISGIEENEAKKRAGQSWSLPKREE